MGPPQATATPQAAGQRYPRHARRDTRAAVHTASVAPRGKPESELSQFSRSARAAPASERLCDLVVLAFALWTVSAHAVVAAGGGLLALLILFALVSAAAVALRLALGAVPTSQDPAGPPPAGAADRRFVRAFRPVALVAGTPAALSLASPSGALHLWWCGSIILVIAAVAVYGSGDAWIDAPERSRTSEKLLWLLAAAAVALTLISHRPDADDAFYVNVAVAAADVPQRALFSADTMHGIPGLPLHLSVYRVASFELLNGAIAYLTGIPAIYAFHWLSAAGAALLVPLAHARLFRVLTPRRWLPSVATALFVLVAAGETHRWYGNFAFVRLWQGKAIFLSVFLPLIYAHAMRFAVRPNRRDWLMLAMAQIAAVGCTSSALWLAPASAIVALCCAAPLSFTGLRIVVLGLLASAYVLGAAWVTSASLAGVLSPDPLIAAPPLFGALVTVLGDSRLLVFGVASLLIGWVFASPGLARRFAVVVPLAVWIGLLNPYTADWVSAHVTGPPYWRSMWAVPLPIIVALVLTSPLDLRWRVLPPGTQRAGWLGVLASFALLVPRYNGLSPENGVRLGWPSLKVPDAAYRWAAAVNERVPPGSQVAVPEEIGTWIVTFQHHAFPLVVRFYLHAWPDALSPDELRDRLAMQRFLDAPELAEATPEPLRDGLNHFQVRAVCLPNSPSAAAARAVLQQERFHPTLRGDDYELWVRRADHGSPRHRQ